MPSNYEVRELDVAMREFRLAQSDIERLQLEAGQYIAKMDAFFANNVGLEVMLTGTVVAAGYVNNGQMELWESNPLFKEHLARPLRPDVYVVQYRPPDERDGLRVVAKDVNQAPPTAFRVAYDSRFFRFDNKKRLLAAQRHHDKKFGPIGG